MPDLERGLTTFLAIQAALNARKRRQQQGARSDRQLDLSERGLDLRQDELDHRIAQGNRPEFMKVRIGDHDAIASVTPDGGVDVLQEFDPGTEIKVQSNTGAFAVFREGQVIERGTLFGVDQDNLPIIRHDDGTMKTLGPDGLALVPGQPTTATEVVGSGIDQRAQQTDLETGKVTFQDLGTTVARSRAQGIDQQNADAATMTSTASAQRATTDAQTALPEQIVKLADAIMATLPEEVSQDDGTIKNVRDVLTQSMGQQAAKSGIEDMDARFERQLQEVQSALSGQPAPDLPRPQPLTDPTEDIMRRIQEYMQQRRGGGVGFRP